MKKKTEKSKVTLERGSMQTWIKKMVENFDLAEVNITTVNGGNNFTDGEIYLQFEKLLLVMMIKAFFTYSQNDSDEITNDATRQQK